MHLNKVTKSVCTNPKDVVEPPAIHEKFILADYSDANDDFNRILVFSSENAKKYTWRCGNISTPMPLSRVALNSFCNYLSYLAT